MHNPESKLMPNIYVEARPKPEGSALEDHVQTRACRLQAQHEANGDAPLVAHVRHLIDKPSAERNRVRRGSFEVSDGGLYQC
jgi:hypothetical protein